LRTLVLVRSIYGGHRGCWRLKSIMREIAKSRNRQNLLHELVLGAVIFGSR
jgi:hypothetical protein